MAKILVIEDMPSVLMSLQMNLAGSGHDVTCATDGITGLRLIIETVFDLVVTDIWMPGLNGIDVISRGRARCFSRLPAETRKAERRRPRLAWKISARMACFISRSCARHFWRWSRPYFLSSRKRVEGSQMYNSSSFDCVLKVNTWTCSVAKGRLWIGKAN